MYQNLVLVGRLGRDPEMRYMPDGTPVTSFSMATDRAYNDKNGQLVRETTWWRVSVFGKQAETANQYLSKGKMVLVEGRLRADPKTGGPQVYTRQDGTVGASFEVIANAIRFLSPKSEGTGSVEGEETLEAGAQHEEQVPF
ncbi:MAG: single-stranded DNA-binding protein [Anaerolineae bacterium]|nr:single-stranded DNA-binding protein [Thermoflexales bacterium]MDW8407129.1 single-stranded DNA-binding protein [Anaerolineae bacterium]